MFDTNSRYIIEDYQKKPTFSSFLPGIAGPMGVPVWCYYNNRGQGVCSFGVKDKDHAIMEFSPAYCAYRDIKFRGFRTFCKVNGEYKELFTDRCDMHIGASELEIFTKIGGLEASALYFGIPEERTAALARVLTIHNTSDTPMQLEMLDGMPEIIPYGADYDTTKKMTQLATAWMRSEDEDKGMACFRLRASMADTARVTEIKGCNFCLGLDENDSLLHPITVQRLVFGEDNSLTLPETFMKNDLKDICGQKQICQNAFPCCFLPKNALIAPGGEIKIFSLYGQSEDKDTVSELAQKINAEWFRKKRSEAARLVDELTNAVNTKTADPIFDGYCRQSYLDNLMRGGVPYFFESGGKKVPFYLYSRKHGDPEREYNYFSLGGEYFAQGNGNFRDVDQNRRCDVLFYPEIGDINIRAFYELIQPDGYNPLVLMAQTYTLDAGELDGLTDKLPSEYRADAAELLSKPFTPGTLAMAAEKWGLTKNDTLSFTAAAVCASQSEPNADFSEGYWCDHWTYNLDLIENYLSVYPEKERELLFGSSDYRWYMPRASVNPRAKRYQMTENGLRQYNALTVLNDRGGKWFGTADGSEARSSLIEKLLLLCAVKTAALDAEGMGIEMEGGKPGWYDALNGLPGLLGSPTAETCELLRLTRFTKEALKTYNEDVALYDEIAGLVFDTADIIGKNSDLFERWDKLNNLKESYRSDTVDGFNGSRKNVKAPKLVSALETMEKALDEGISRAMTYGSGVLPTYFIFEAADITETADGYVPKKLTPKPLPLFLEAPVHWLKLSYSKEQKKTMAENIKHSGLYDSELNMYKVNEELKDVSFEAGRTKAFTRGWLENESIWLHMEYKYILELLRSGLYEEFSEAFRRAAIPFVDPDRYGRSPLENVSFIVSSANADSSEWGRGFTARLSGSTAEFLEIWQLMFFGARPFRMTENGLTLNLAPYIPEYLIPESGEIQVVFLGNIPVTYHIADGARHSGRFEASKWTLTFADNTKRVINGSFLSDSEAYAVRDESVKNIYIDLV